jgi:hypothetical protein
MPMDAEMLEELRADAARSLQVLVREKPFLALGGAAAVGFLLGGGWRTRIGRFLMLGAARYLVVHAAGRYFNA